MPSPAKILICILVALLISCEGREAIVSPLVSPSVSPTPAQAPVEIDSEDFKIALGPEWKMEREGESYVFNDENNLRQITIAVLRPREIASEPEIEHLGREATRIRQDAMRKLSNGKAQFSQIKSVKVGKGYDLTFSAVDQINGVKVRSMTFARSERIVTISFNKYSPFPSDEELDRQFADILAKIELKN